MAGRPTSPNGSRPGWPTFHKPNENLCSGPGVSGSLAMARTLSPQSQGRDLEGTEVEPDRSADHVHRFPVAFEQVDHRGVPHREPEAHGDRAASAPRLVKPHHQVV